MVQVGNAPCSWGVLEFDLQADDIAFSRVLDEMAETGYAGAELGEWGFLLTDPDQLKAELDARGLTMLGAFVEVRLRDPSAHGAGESAALRTARLLSAVQGTDPFIVLADNNATDPVRMACAGRVRPADGLSDSEWEVFAAGAERIAEAVLHETGLRTVFHHHCAGFVETPAETEKLLSLTRSTLLGLCFDTGHWRFGGGDPVDGIRRFSDRIWHVHFKDCHPEIAARSRAECWDYLRSVREGVFCELGAGDVPFASVKAELDRLRYDGWIVVEQDVLPGLGTPRESARRNRAYLRGTGL